MGGAGLGREPTVKEALLWAVAVLRGAGLDDPRASAEILLSHALGVSRGRLLACGDDPLPLDKWEEFVGLVERRRRRVPLPYILGSWEFMGLHFVVRPGVLAPRPETETLVEAVMEELSDRGIRRPVIADIGTGCGAIAVSLAKYIEGAKVVAVDISPFCVEVAKENAERHGVLGRVEVLLGDLFEPLRERGLLEAFDVVCGNLPYVPREAIGRLQPEVGKFEPKVALDGGPEGRDLLTRAALEAHKFVKKGGFCAWEFGAGQWPWVRTLLKSAPGVRRIGMRRDLSGRPRVALAFY